MLAGGRLSGQQRERILERLPDAARDRRRNWVVAVTALVPLAAAITLLVRPQHSKTTAESATVGMASGLRPKGGDAPMLAARCEGRATGKCRVGDRLIFEVDGLTRPSSFGAYADCDGRERIWYFPTADGAEPELTPADRSVVNQAARVGQEHGVGACQLHLFLLQKPTSRNALAAGKPDGGVETIQTLEIEP